MCRWIQWLKNIFVHVVILPTAGRYLEFFFGENPESGNCQTGARQSTDSILTGVQQLIGCVRQPRQPTAAGIL